MLPDEMQRLEAAALEDPFLADAIEGMRLRLSNAGEQMLQQDVNELRSRLEKGQMIRLGIWWKVAAILVVVVTGIAITYSIVRNDDGGSALVSHVQTKKLQNETYEGNKAPAPAPVDSTVSEAAPATARMKRQSALADLDSNNKPEERAALSQQAAKSDIPTAQAQPQRAEARLKADTSDAGEQLQDRTAGIAVDENEKPAAAKSQGYEHNRVLNAETAPNDNVTNRKSQSKENARIANNNAANNELSEVVVVGFGTSRNNANERTLNTAGSKRFEPEGGWTTFHNYINNNRTLKAPPDNNLEEVSFIPDEKGKPSDIRILRSISREHDAEAIRLLTEGPSWKILRGKKKRITIHMYF